MDSSFSLFMFVSILFLGGIFLAAFITRVWLPFTHERRYIKGEIHRTEGDERKYWKRELRILYICQIPVIGWIIMKIRNG